MLQSAHVTIPREKDIRFPLLKLIAEAGGSLSSAQAIARLGQTFPNVSARDRQYEDIPGRKLWNKRVAIARSNLVHDGLLFDGPRGVWRITSRGLEHLEACSPDSHGMTGHLSAQVHVRAWAVRPYPHMIYRLEEFLDQGVAAIGWDIGDLSSCTRDEISQRLFVRYRYKARELGQATGIIWRFVHEIACGDIVMVPDGKDVYCGIVSRTYWHDSKYAGDQQGYADRIGVHYFIRPLSRSMLPGSLRTALKGRQTVFSLPAREVWDYLSGKLASD